MEVIYRSGNRVKCDSSALILGTEVEKFEDLRPMFFCLVFCVERERGERCAKAATVQSLGARADKEVSRRILHFKKKEIYFRLGFVSRKHPLSSFLYTRSLLIS